TRRLPRLQSQQYGFDLVRSAVRRGAVVVFLRGERLWSETVPELTKTARTPAAVLNKRRPYLSPGNLPPGVYALVSQVVERR
ncbi:MAG TPA: hypothetical protein VGJ54_02700, partial [Streptosporangiaceae bacterium]